MLINQKLVIINDQLIIILMYNIYTIVCETNKELITMHYMRHWVMFD